MECFSCRKKFSETENYDKHLISEEHKQKILSVQEKQNDLPDESKPVSSSNSNYNGTIKCDLCDLSFNSVLCFQKHSVTPEHALKIMLKCSNPKTTMTNHELNAMKGETTNNDCILPELNKSPDFSYGKCEICAKMFSGPEPYKQHLESQAHKKKVALQQNFTYAGGNNILKCEPCNKSFSGQVPYAQHMISETHKKKLENIQAMENFRRTYSSDSQIGIKENAANIDLNKVFFCNTCKKECSGWIPYQQHLAGSIHFKNEKRAQSQQMPVASLTQLQVSKVSEEYENVTQIVNGSCERDYIKRENDSVLEKIINDIEKVKIMSDDKLGELIRIIPEDEEIKFDLDQPEEPANEMPALIKQDENQNNETSQHNTKV